MKTTTESTPRTAAETNFLKKVRDYAETTTSDIRTTAETIRTLATAYGIDAKVGTGGHHIWITRTGEDKRFAIITE